VVYATVNPAKTRWDKEDHEIFDLVSDLVAAEGESVFLFLGLLWLLRFVARVTATGLAVEGLE